MAKKVFYDDDARTRVLGGAKALYDAVKVTYGPKGNNVVIGRAYGGPTITHDGVTVAEAIDLPENDDATLGFKTGAQWIQEAARKLNKSAGDGTTTVTVLTYSILKEANRLIAAGHNAQELRKGIEAAGAEVLEMLTELAEGIDNDSPRVAEIATISAGDPVIGKIIADVIKEIGKEGVVTVEPSQGTEIVSEIVEGYTFERGWPSPLFITDQSKQEAVLDKPAIIITDKHLNNAQELVPLFEGMITKGIKNVVVIADQIDGDALAVMIINKMKGVLNLVAINAPSFGDRRKEILHDIAILTGGTVISDDTEVTFQTADLNALGSALKVVVGKDTTTIIAGGGKTEDIQERLEVISTQTKSSDSEWEVSQYQKRAAALQGKVAVIKVGGASETEIDEKKYRVDDAVAATQVALSEGIVAGGGITLLNISNNLRGKTAGHLLVAKALIQPFLLITNNAGLNGDALRYKVIESELPGFGINVMEPDAGLIDLKAAGVIDPVRVTKDAVAAAVSIAATAATMGALVVDIPEPAPAVPEQQLGY